MATKKTPPHDLLCKQLHHLSDCTLSEASAYVMMLEGKTDINPYHKSPIFEYCPNYYPSDLSFTDWRWSWVDQYGNDIALDNIIENTPDNQLRSITGTRVTIFDVIRGKNVEFTYRLQHKDLDPKSRQNSIFASHPDLTISNH